LDNNKAEEIKYSIDALVSEMKKSRAIEIAKLKLTLLKAKTNGATEEVLKPIYTDISNNEY